MNLDITRLHHTGHLVTDLTAGADRYRRLGFSVPAPVFPGIESEDEPLRVIGAGNTRIAFPHNFIELIGLAGDRLPADATIAPLSLTPQAKAAIEHTTRRLTDELATGQGMRVLAWQAADADAVAARLTDTGVPHSGVIRLERPGPDGEPVAVGYLELDADGTSEGRLAIAEGNPAEVTTHPNGAIRLSEAVTCAEPTAPVVERYRRYLDRAAPDGVFELAETSVWIATGDQIARRFDGYRPPPGFVGHLVAVTDLTETLDYLRANAIPVRHAATGEVFTEVDGCLVGFTRS